MIGTSRVEYIFIGLAISCLRAISPSSIAYCCYRIFSREAHLWLIPLDIWAVSEVLFFFVAYLPLWYRCQRPVIHPPPSSREQRRELFQRCQDHIRDPDRYLSKWFADAPLSEIKRKNVKDFFSWAFFNAETLGPDFEEELDEYVTQFEQKLGRPFETGRGKAKCLSLTVDPVRMLHRPLLWYLIVFIVDSCTHLSMVFHGFQYYSTALRIIPSALPLRPLTLFAHGRSPVKHLSYWFRPHTSKKRLPVVFLHGIGIGLYSYVSFLAALRENGDDDDGDVGIIAIEILPISFRITHAALPREEMCRQLQIILNKHGIDRFVLVSHSYGSVITTHLLKTVDIRDQIASVVLVDPVSILLHLPDVAYNFTYREPKAANELQLYYFACTDMGVAHTLFRGFFWSDNILWKEDVGDLDITVSLAGKDQIVNTKEVAAYLMAEGEDSNDQPEQGDWKSKPGVWLSTDKRLKVLWCEELDHAQVFERKLYRDCLVAEVRRLSSHGCSDAVRSPRQLLQ